MVVLTALTSDDDRRRILAAGFNTYFSKPVAPLDLMRFLANLKAARTSPPATCEVARLALAPVIDV